jgi:hypothetical protein
VPLQYRQSLEHDCFPPQTMQDSGTDFSSRLPAQSSSFDRYASLEGAEPHSAEFWQFGRNKQEQIRPLGSPGACVGRNRFAAYG